MRPKHRVTFGTKSNIRFLRWIAGDQTLGFRLIADFENREPVRSSRIGDRSKHNYRSLFVHHVGPIHGVRLH